MLTLDQLVETVGAYRRVLITTHVSPDADAIGSSCGLHLGLRELGIESSVYLGDPIPEYVLPLVGDSKVVHTVPNEEFDALIVVDTASRKRMSGGLQPEQVLTKTVLNIDHHESNDGWGTLNYIEPRSPSASVLVAKLLFGMKVTLSPAVANLLLAGLVDDTGSFRFSNATPESFAAASELVAAGASPSKVATVLYFSIPERVLRLRALALSELHLSENGLIATVPVTKQMVIQTEGKPEDSEGIVDFVRSVRGTVAAALIRELDDGWKVSLRSKEEWLDVNAIAGQFGGGGHRAAAGCKLNGTLAEVQTTIIGALAAAIQQSKPQ